MRTITLSGQDFIVNPLKGKDIKALKAQGFDLMGGGYSISEGMDAVFATAGFDAAGRWRAARPSISPARQTPRQTVLRFQTLSAAYRRALC